MSAVGSKYIIQPDFDSKDSFVIVFCVNVGSIVSL